MEAGEYEKLYSLDELGVEELEKFKREATSILESVKFHVHKWESDVEDLESKDSTNPSQRQHKPPETQRKDSQLQSFISWRRDVWRGTYRTCARADNAPGICTMARVKTDRWMPKLRSKVKKVINECNVCKVFSTGLYRSTTTTVMPTFRTKDGRPFETGWVDFAGPLEFKITKRTRQVIRFVLQFFRLESGATGNDGRRVSKKTEFVHCQN